MKGKVLPWARVNYFSVIIAALFLLHSIVSIAQEEKSASKTKRSDFKNSIKLNLTSQIVYDNAFLLGYERVLNNHRTLNISGGYMEFPISLKVPDFLKLKEQRKKSGYNVTVDYRFYLANENKYAAPHGIYLAPFISLHQFRSNRNFTYTDSTGAAKDGQMDNRINFFTVGGQLGYQFVIKRRFVIDAVLFGPGITNYYFKVKLDGNLSDADKNALQAKIIEALRAKLPLLDDIATNKEASGSGIETFWSVGFRYSVSIGYRFW